MTESFPALDHFVLSCRDLDKGERCYARLGFNVMPRMMHIDIGTSNHVIQFRDTYLELIGHLERSLPLLQEKMLKRFRAGDGLSINSLTSTSLENDRQWVKSRSLSPERIISARRKVDMPDGSEDETDSSCFYIWREDKEYLSLFYSQHYKPHTIFIPEYYQAHPNGVQGIYGLVYVSRSPGEDLDYFSTLFRQPPVAADEGYLKFVGGRGDLFEVCAPERLNDHFPGVCLPEPLPLPGYPVGLRMWVDSVEQSAAWLAQQGVDISRSNDGIRIGADNAMGATLELVDALALPDSYRAFANRQQS